MKAILCSKLYKTSARKDAILSKLSDPINVELVTQLREYLDDEYLTPEYFPTEDESDKPSEETADEVTTDPVPNTPPRSSNPSMPSTLPSFDEPSLDLDEDVDKTDNISDESEEVDVDVADEPSDTEDAEVQEAVAITSVDTDLADTQNVDSIEDTLNAKNTTSGVVRTKQRGNEFWIYYDDSINLNNVMGAVIDALSGPEFNYLDFNRLARTDNAIVFELRGR